MKKLLLGVLCCATAFVLIGCEKMEDVSASGGKSWFDTTYTFDKAMIKLQDDTCITVDVQSWLDYEDGEQLQITSTDGTVYLVSSYNCTLIKER